MMMPVIVLKGQLQGMGQSIHAQTIQIFPNTQEPKYVRKRIDSKWLYLVCHLVRGWTYLMEIYNLLRNHIHSIKIKQLGIKAIPCPHVIAIAQKEGYQMPQGLM